MNFIKIHIFAPPCNILYISLLDLQNSSYPTQPYSIIAKYMFIKYNQIASIDLKTTVIDCKITKSYLLCDWV